MDDYAQFLASKAAVSHSRGIPFEESDLGERPFHFQRDIIRWGLRKGRCAFFTDTGTGKTGMQVTVARIVAKIVERVLIFAPLAVREQTIEDAINFGSDIKLADKQSDCEAPGIYITNYDKLHLFDMTKFGAVILDESSVLKHEDSATRKALQDACANIEYKLCCSATPSPNDYAELGTHAEFLGVMTMQEMLATYFIHDGGDTSKWRLKGHAEEAFWKWLATWAICIRKPSDLGYSDEGFTLPPLVIHEHIVKAENQKPVEGMLVALPAGTLKERQAARRGSITERVAKASEIISDSEEAWLVWCKLNDESTATTKAITGVEITGSNSPELKAKCMIEFAHGSISRLVSKPSICGFGLNFQVCHNVVFIGMDDSYESYYQAVRRCYRYGQQHEVHVHLIISEAEVAVLENIKRKQAQADLMMERMVAGMAEIMREEIHGTTRREETYMTNTAIGQNFKLHLGDCVEGLRVQPDESIDYFIFSPAFKALYTYSASLRDMGNVKTDAEFDMHFGFLAPEIFRTLKPGRLISVHCMDIPSMKSRDGVIGLKDFPAELRACFERVGFIYHSKVMIWKDPLIEATRTKALGLMHKQVVKDSSMCRQGLPDYIVTMRKPGNNAAPIANPNGFQEYIGEDEPIGVKKEATIKAGETRSNRSISTEDDPIYSHQVWRRYASSVWMDINQSGTLQRESARDEEDEKHIAPLQLQVISRCLRLWTNPGDLVCSPFAGIGSEGHEALKMGRKFIGWELKPSYFAQAMKNLARVESETNYDLFSQPVRNSEDTTRVAPCESIAS